MSIVTRGLCAAVAVALLSAPALRAAERDTLDDVKDRMALEAQRVEKEFAEKRAEAYKLVRSASPSYADAYAKVRELLSLLRMDTSLDPKRREQLIVTLEWDIGKLKEIAAEHRRSTTSDGIGRAVRSEVRSGSSGSAGRRDSDLRGASSRADDIIGSRGKVVADSRTGRLDREGRTIRVIEEVHKSAAGETGDYVLPRDWREKMMRRGTGPKMTAKEQEIMKVLNTAISVDYKGLSFEQVIEDLEKVTGLSFAIDKRALEEANISYAETKIDLRLKATTRMVLKRLLGDLGLAYVIEKEQVFITSAARAREKTTVRYYSVADIAGAVDYRFGPLVAQAQAIENINRVMAMITQTFDPQSWQVNNPEAAGTITFDPISMSLIIKQTAEFHYMRGGR